MRLLFGLGFTAMRVEQRAKRGGVNATVGQHSACGALECAHRFLGVIDFDLCDETIESKSNRRIAHAVRVGEFFQRSAGQNESLQESEVFVVEEINPPHVDKDKQSEYQCQYNSSQIAVWINKIKIAVPDRDVR